MVPLKDREAYRAYMREWYARPENKKRTLAKVAARKKTVLVGVCRNCGAKTCGNDLKHIPEWCSRRECRRAQWAEKQGYTKPRREGPSYGPRSRLLEWQKGARPIRWKTR